MFHIARRRYRPQVHAADLPVTPSAIAIAKYNLLSRRADRIFRRLADISIVESN